MSAEPIREIFIDVLRENDGELLRTLLKALNWDQSIEARLLENCLVRQPEFRDLIGASEGLISCQSASRRREQGYNDGSTTVGDARGQFRLATLNKKVHT